MMLGRARPKVIYYGKYSKALIIRELKTSILFVLGLDKIEFLQSHENLDIYQKSFEIIENYFGSEEEDGRLAPAVSSTTDQYQFSADQSVPMGGFQF